MRHRHTWLPAVLAALFLLPAGPGCTPEQNLETPGTLKAVRIDRKQQLIGGPTARGKIGDYLIENDQVRFIIAGKGQTWNGGVFGGSVVDADVQRWWPEFRYGNGWDGFSETFPLVNLVVANPELPGQILGTSDEGLHLTAIPSGIEVLKDGSDGEAVIRVTGRVGYMFETFKFLNKDFLRSFLEEPLELFGLEMSIPDLLNAFLGVNVYALINRLQLDFQFTNDYILHEGDRYLTLRTTIVTAPPTEQALELCDTVECDLECADGYALREIEYVREGSTAKGKALCPVCECAEPVQEMSTLNESEDIFQIMLGDLEPWRDPAWKGGLLGGDFLFFGSEANIFTPGLGFDEDRKIFENMWQGVPTLANPLTFDWVAAVAPNVSYGWVTRNPDRREGLDCPTYRLAITRLTYADEQAVVDVLVNQLGLSEDFAESRARHVIVDRRPLPLAEVAVPAGTSDFAAWRDETLAQQTVDVIDPDDPENTVPQPVAGLFPAGVGLDLVPAVECQMSKVLIPIFSTSATAVMTHKSPSSLELVEGTPVDNRRTYVFERYLVVGDGDVGSVLGTVYDLKEIDYGHVEGAVFDGNTRGPVTHASVFALRDPRPDPADPVPATYAEALELCRERFGHSGFVSQMQSDRGVDKLHDGDFSGPLEPGNYLLVAFGKGRGVSKPVPVTVAAGETAVAQLLIPPEGTVKYMVRDNTGRLLPSRLTFIALDSDGEPARFDAMAHVELGGSRYDHGIYLTEHSAAGKGTLHLPAGAYEIYVSRGFEYSIEHIESFEVPGGQTVTLETVLTREMDTSGYVSGDFHVHARPSIDSSLPLETRVAANAAEGVEFITSTDHDVLVDYMPYINALDLEAFVTSAVGVETTTLEFGHYNGFPMEYDHTDLPVHDPAPWYGLPLSQVWEEMRSRVQEGVSPENFIIQVNHPRDGFMGFFSQFGLKGYNMQRATPGMEMCNPQTEVIPCDFDSMELMNEKRFELIRTPTIGEKEMHNQCFAQVMGVADKARFAQSHDAALCDGLRQPPHAECATIDDAVAGTQADGLELAALLSIRDHCAWHEEFAEEFGACTEDMSLVDCKEQGLAALKLLTVRYMLERSPREQEAYFATTTETDPGCDLEAALAGTTANLDEDGVALAGCGGEDCPCESCVCAAHPECCVEPEDGDPTPEATGWDDACAGYCVDECYGGLDRPCTSKQNILEDWFAFLNRGFNKTAMGNSDSHNVKAEVGLPRNWIRSSSDTPSQVDPEELFRNIKEHRVFISTGPFVEFSVAGGELGDTVTAPGGDTLAARIRIQTPSWFGIDHVEIYRNGKLEHILRVSPAPEALVDFDETVDLPMPDEDSWYVLITYGLESRYLLSPVYKRIPLGKILIPTIISLGAQSILISFDSVLREVEENFGAFLGDEGLDGLLGGLLGTEELPDSFPMFPFALTNPVWVDLDGDGFTPPEAVDADGDGEWDLPPFCSQPCEVANPTCGENQICRPDSQGAATGMCAIPIPDNCIRSQTQ